MIAYSREKSLRFPGEALPIFDGGGAQTDN
jgi:hypothetical protein